MTLGDGIYLAAGVASAAGALLAVTRRSPLYGALWLLVTLLGLAGVFYRVAAPFLAMMQVTVYAGAILVLFLFVIMLLNLRPEDLREEAPAAERVVAAVVSLALFGALAAGILSSAGSLATAPAAPATFGTLEGVGRALFSRHVLAFEALSVLIVTAVVGAVLLAKRKL